MKNKTWRPARFSGLAFGLPRFQPGLRAIATPDTKPAQAASSVGTAFEWLALLASACVVVGVLLDALGVPLTPLAIGLAALLLLAPLAALSLRGRRRSAFDWPTDLVVVLIGAGVAWQLLAASGSALLPVGNSVDAVHHTLLARYILQHGTLVHNPADAVAQLGEMVDYPPGFALLAALPAAVFGVGAHQVVYAVAVLAVVLTVCGISLLAAAGATGPARPLAAAAGLLVLLVPEYSLGIVAAENYYAQALAQCLIVACTYLAVGGRQTALPLVASKLGLLLLALVFVYTTWLPIALVAVAAGLLARGERPALRLLTGAVLLGGAAAIGTLFGAARTGTAAEVVLHEGSTIRDPLGATGLVLPLLAVAGLPLGVFRRERWPGLGLIAGTILLLAGFGVLWQRGAVAGYIFYKLFYLLAIVLPLPIGWLLAAAVEWLSARRAAFTPAARLLALAVGLLGALAAFAGAPLLPSTASAAAHPLTPALGRAAHWLERRGASDVMYALRQPGLPAYWVHIGLLGRTRDGAAERLLREAPALFDEWYYDPRAPRYLLLESTAAPPELPGTATGFHSGDVWVLEKTASYPAAVARARPLLVAFRSAVAVDGLELRLDVAGAAASDALGVQLAAVSGDKDLAAHTLTLPEDDAARLELRFDARNLAASTGQAGLRSTTDERGAANKGGYDVVLRLLHGEQIVAQRQLAACDLGSCVVLAPAGAWSYALPPPTPPTTPLQLGLGDTVDLVGASIERSTLKAGDELQLGLRWTTQQTQPRYVAFVQLIAADGGAAVSVEGEPGGGMAPTWRWKAGDTIDDRWTVKVGAGVQPGRYQLVVGLYDPRSGERLPAWRRAPFVERFWTGALPLGEIVVEQ